MIPTQKFWDPGAARHLICTRLTIAEYELSDVDTSPADRPSLIDQRDLPEPSLPRRFDQTWFHAAIPIKKDCAGYSSARKHHAKSACFHKGKRKNFCDMDLRFTLLFVLQCDRSLAQGCGPARNEEH